MEHPFQSQTHMMSRAAEDLVLDIFDLMQGQDTEDIERALCACLFTSMVLSQTWSRFVEDSEQQLRFRCDVEHVTRESMRDCQ